MQAAKLSGGDHRRFCDVPPTASRSPTQVPNLVFFMGIGYYALVTVHFFPPQECRRPTFQGVQYTLSGLICVD